MFVNFLWDKMWSTTTVVVFFFEFYRLRDVMIVLAVLLKVRAKNCCLYRPGR
jgi:hypothetical protein